MTGDRRGSVDVFEGFWQEYLAEGDLPEFSPQEQLFAVRKNEALLALLPPAPATILECGCGSGEVSAFLAERGYTVTLLDDSPSALAFAESRFQRAGLEATFIKGNVYDLPFEDGAFDILLSFGLLEHFEDVDKVIDEMARVIRPGGYFFADIVTERFSIQTVGHLFNGLVRVLYHTAKGKPGHGFSEARKLLKPDFYENTYGADAYVQYMKNAGLKDVELHGNRPFPMLTLPGPIEQVYVKAMKLAMPFWRWFDTQGGGLARSIGAGWWAWGTKE